MIKSYIENGKFTILADFGKMKQKIYLDIENYRIFFKEVLDADHSKIVNFLKFNGTIFELSGSTKQNMSI